MHSWGFPDSNTPTNDPATILPRSHTPAGCWPDHGEANISGNVFHRSADNGNYAKRRADDWLAALAKIRAGLSKTRSRSVRRCPTQLNPRRRYHRHRAASCTTTRATAPIHRIPIHVLHAYAQYADARFCGDCSCCCGGAAPPCAWPR